MLTKFNLGKEYFFKEIPSKPKQYRVRIYRQGFDKVDYSNQDPLADEPRNIDLIFLLGTNGEYYLDDWN